MSDNLSAVDANPDRGTLSQKVPLETPATVRHLLRDAEGIGALDMPAYHARPSAPTNLTLHEAIDINVPIGCGDAPVFPGDVIVGDGDGVVVLPAHLADEIAEECAGMEDFETFVLESVRAGHSIIGLYPPTREETRQRYQQWLKDRGR